MKRTSPLRRTTLKRTRMVRRPRTKYDDAEAKAQYHAEHDACACCWSRQRQFGVRVELHHILGNRWSRPDTAANFLMLCVQSDSDDPSCHLLEQGFAIRRSNGLLWPKLSLANCLWLKRDVGEFDLAWMTAWVARFGRWKLPEPEMPPLELLAVRERLGRSR